MMTTVELKPPQPTRKESIRLRACRPGPTRSVSPSTVKLDRSRLPLQPEIQRLPISNYHLSDINNIQHDARHAWIHWPNGPLAPAKSFGALAEWAIGWHWLSGRLGGTG
jgi:hypothetical protein